MDLLNKNYCHLSRKYTRDIHSEIQNGIWAKFCFQVTGFERAVLSVRMMDSGILPGGAGIDESCSTF